MKKLLTALACLFLGTPVPILVQAAPLPESAVPQPLKTWVPWALYGHETRTCPAPYNMTDGQACVWPARLDLVATPNGASFRFEVSVFGTPSWVALPGEPGRWPQDVLANGRALAVSARNQLPMTELPVGHHVISGTLPWVEMPQSVLLPREVGIVQLSINGKVAPRNADADGRVWLQPAQTPDATTEAITVRTVRLIEDDIPLRVTTHYDIAVSGKAREIQLPAALLPGFVAESLTSALPARLHDEGQLRLQARPGNWTVQVRARLMQPTTALQLPDGGRPDEVWSFAARSDLRVVTVDGVPTVDPKQVPMPEDWRAYPAYQMRAGQTFKLNETRRGNPQPGADQLRLARQIWLDFDGDGYTLRDEIVGTLSRSWRLEMAAPATLGRAGVNGEDQPVTRRADTEVDGVELRRGALNLVADSRVNSDTRTLPVTGWLTDFNGVSAQLHTPPGWRLLHASGVDQASGSWVGRWTLWDFFFVLLSSLAAGKLLGRKAGAVMAGALILTWHMSGAPQSIWLVLMGLAALTRVLPAGRLLKVATNTSWLVTALLALMLVPYAVEQIRLSIYPALEHPHIQIGIQEQSPVRAPQSAASEPAEAAEAAAPAQMDANADQASAEQTEPSSTVEKRKAPYPAARKALKQQERTLAYSMSSLNEVDPSVKVQTGPGLPSWNWTRYTLTWYGPVQSTQNMHLYLMSPTATVVWRLAGLGLLLAAFWMLISVLPGWTQRPRFNFTTPTWSRKGSGAAAALMTALGLTSLSTWSDPAQAANPPQENIAQPQGQTPTPQLLDELRTRLTAPPNCLPHCADVTRLAVIAQNNRVQLRLEVHALADTMVPLPAQGTHWQPSVVSINGAPATVRRDRAGVLWMATRSGVHQVVLAADVGEISNVEIALPMPVRAVSVQTEGWALAGLDARGMATGALSLARTVPTPSGAPTLSSAPSDALPPFVRVERTLQLGLRWTVQTQITRLAPSRAPVRVKVALLDGESVNSDSARIEGGYAIVQMGSEDSVAFVSTLKETAQIDLASTDVPHQIEQWQLQPSALWHVQWSGIAPVQYTDANARLQPRWQPWPGERVSLHVSKPAGTPGQTLTVDRLLLSLSPGQRTTDVRSTALLRSSQGGNHRVQLPEGAQFLGLTLNGQSQPLQPQNNALLIPITPGAHQVQINWREPRGIQTFFKTTPHGMGIPSVNAHTEINLPRDRVVLAVGGPRIGPAVLFWGIVVALVGMALLLARSGLTPLHATAWFLLGLGLAQTSLWGVAAVVGWFIALAARSRFVLHQEDNAVGWKRLGTNLMQLLLVLWTLIAAAVLLNTVRVGLLGYPDMMVLGNGSSASTLRWYQDRTADTMTPAWVLTAPAWAYRLLMLAWALWLSASILKWVKWAWASFSHGGYWRKREMMVGTQ